MAPALQQTRQMSKRKQEVSERSPLTLDKIIKVLDAQRTDDRCFNVALYIYLTLYDDVMLINKEDMCQLVQKMYTFTPKFNQVQDQRYTGMEWPDRDATIIFTN